MDLALKPVVRDGLTLGYELVTAYCHYFFGTGQLPKESLPHLFPKYEFRHLKQVHGDRVIESQRDTQEADAHWTTHTGVALTIQTADCLPVLFGSEKGALAVHAGWRGVENEILVESAKIWRNFHSNNTQIVVGPHIHAVSFEVGIEVSDKLLAAFEKTKSTGPSPILSHSDPQKRRVDLSRIAVAQLQNVLGHDLSPLVTRQNTYEDELFHSFRRGKAPQGRQFSFVVRL